jgi:uncharacterized peroxidase-related enzyme
VVDVKRFPEKDELKSEKARKIYEEIEKEFGGIIPNFFKAMASDPEWLEVNWERHKRIMQTGELDRKTKELIAYAVSIARGCEYCALAHHTAALMHGATEKEVLEAVQVVELYMSFTTIADAMQVPCDITPDILNKM